jgi:hypothetical protein
MMKLVDDYKIFKADLNGLKELETALKREMGVCELCSFLAGIVVGALTLGLFAAIVTYVG